MINADNTATFLTGGIRQGTGSDTGLLMIGGEELDMDMSQLKFVMADTALTPNTGQHSASNTIRNCRSRAPRSGGVGEAGPARARLDAARRADHAALRQ